MQEASCPILKGGHPTSAEPFQELVWGWNSSASKFGHQMTFGGQWWEDVRWVIGCLVKSGRQMSGLSDLLSTINDFEPWKEASPSTWVVVTSATLYPPSLVGEIPITTCGYAYNSPFSSFLPAFITSFFLYLKHILLYICVVPRTLEKKSAKVTPQVTVPFPTGISPLAVWSLLVSFP